MNSNLSQYTKVSKEFHWEMAHRLPFHEGLCKNIHGHSYKLLISLYGELDENGMLVDFYDIDKVMKPIVTDFDHAFVAGENDTKVIAFLKEMDFKHLVVPYTTTSENLIRYIADRAVPLFREFVAVKAISIRLYETIDAYAEIQIDL